MLKSSEPVTQGLVLFESEKLSDMSDIKEDGTYSIGLIKPGEGIPPSTYNISGNRHNGRQFAIAFADANVPVCAKNPLHIRLYARSLGTYAKTDEDNAKIIAQYALERKVDAM